MDYKPLVYNVFISSIVITRLYIQILEIFDAVDGYIGVNLIEFQ